MAYKHTKRGSRRGKGKSPIMQAGEFMGEMEHMGTGGRGGARPGRPAIAMGIAKARRAGADLPMPGTKRGTRGKPAKRRAGSTTSRSAMAKQPRAAAARRGSSSRTGARKAARKSPAKRARKSSRTRATHR
jgi:hypothetical protein